MYLYDMKNHVSMTIYVITFAMQLTYMSIPAVSQEYDYPRRDSVSLNGTFTVSGHQVDVRMPVNAFVLSGIPGDNDPFYHASGLLHMVPSLEIDDRVEIQLRLVAENWNFSASYEAGNNLILWAKPRVTVRLPFSSVIDSLRISAGDLWRVTAGRGLALDYYEGMGSNTRVVAGKMAYELTTIGYGWTGLDDIYLFSVSYDSSYRINVFSNHFSTIDEVDYEYRDCLMFSADAEHSIGPVLIWAEVGYMYGRGPAGLIGAMYGYHSPSFEFEVSGQYRWYHDDFFSSSISDYIDIPFAYFNSLTALDKPVAIYRSFTDDPSGLQLLVRAKAKIVGPFFIGTTTESFRAVYSDTYVGIAVDEIAEVSVGYLNKLFVLSRDSSFPFPTENNGPMFRQEGIALVRIRARF